MPRRAIAAFLIVLALPFGAGAQGRSETLADIRGELSALGAEIAGLRAELVSTGAVAQFGGASALERMDVIEAELRRLTGRTEDLQFRIERIIADGTNRLADLEFRLLELEGGDPAALGQAAPLGGGLPVVATAPEGTAPPRTATPIASEQANFDRAREVLGQRDFRGAADLLAAHAAAFPSGPLTGEAHFLRGEALEQLGETAAAARAYLESFSGYPEGPRAADALLRLGLALGRMGQRPEACVTLGEVGARYPGSDAAGAAYAAMPGLGCG